MYIRKVFFMITAILLFYSELYAQTDKVQQGVLFKKGTSIRIAHADIYDARNKYRVSSNDFGIFRIMAGKGDTLEISGAGYRMQKFAVSDFRDTIIYLQQTNELDEVIIRRNSIQQDLKEVQDAYRSKGIYYKGRPPIYLLIFKPLTFLNELVGKNGKRARRFSKYASEEIDYYEVNRRFNNTSIKNVVSISDSELENFKTIYRPTTEQIKQWNEYDLITYIKASYKKFKQSHKGG